MYINNDVAVFASVAQSIKESPKKHSYVQVVGYSCKERKNKKKASTLEDITTYVANILNSKADLEDKKSIARSFGFILGPFAKKQTIFHSNAKQIARARAILIGFANYIQKDVNDIEKLKEFGSFYKDAGDAHYSLRFKEIGDFVIWKGAECYFFYQKWGKGDDFSEKNATRIPFCEEVIPIVSYLTSRENILEKFKHEGICFEDYKRAAEHLGSSTSYAFFYKKGELHFIQKVPGIPLAKWQSIPVPLEDNLFAFIRDQTQRKNRFELLEKNGVRISTNSQDFESLRERTERYGGWFINCNSLRASSEMVWLDEFWVLETLPLFVLSSEDIFLKIDQCLNTLRQRVESFAANNLSEHIFSLSNAAIAFLMKQPAGQYAIVKEGPHLKLFIRMPLEAKKVTKTLMQVQTGNLVEKLPEYISNGGLIGLLAKRNYVARNRREAVRKLNTESIHYVVLLEQSKYRLLFRRSPEEITLDASQNFFAQIEKHILAKLTTYPQFAKDKKEALSELRENSKIGAFSFRKTRHEQYKVYLRTSESQIDKFYLNKEELFPLLEEEPAQQLWMLLKHAGYAFDFDNLHEAKKHLEDFTRKYILWKCGGKIRFIPVCKGFLSSHTLSVFVDYTSLKCFQENFEKALKPSTDQVYQWLSESYLVVKDEQQARERLVLESLGSYLTWKEGDTLYFLQKRDTQGPILNKRIALSKENPLAMLHALNSKEAEQYWLD